MSKTIAATLEIMIWLQEHDTGPASYDLAWFSMPQHGIMWKMTQDGL